MPTAQPLFLISADVMLAGADERATFRGERGTYSWTSVSFPEAYAIVRWDVTASDFDCRVEWSVDPSSGSRISDRVAVAAGDRETGNDRFRTDFSDGAVSIESNCEKWLVTIQGDTPPPPTPRPTRASGGGNCHPSYRGVCLRPNSGDYDCAGGSGNGPYYVSGPISVVGYDEFDLDRDGDGIGCE